MKPHFTDAVKTIARNQIGNHDKFEWYLTNKRLKNTEKHTIL